MSFRIGYSGPVIDSLLDKAVNCTIINNGWIRYDSSDSNPCNLNNLGTPGNYTISYWTNGPKKINSIGLLSISVAIDTNTNKVYQTIYDNGRLYTRKTSDNGTFDDPWEEVQSENEIYVGTEAPTDPQDNYLWLNTSTTVPCIRIYNASTKKWMDIMPGGDMAEVSIYDPQGYQCNFLDYFMIKLAQYGYITANKDYNSHVNVSLMPYNTDNWKSCSWGTLNNFNCNDLSSGFFGIYDIAFSETIGRFVATGINMGTATFLYSDDGITWNEGNIYEEEFQSRFLYICGVIWNNEHNMFVGLGGPSGNAAYSYDGIYWHVVTTGELLAHNWTQVRYLNNRFVAFEDPNFSWQQFGIVDGANKVGMIYSEDGKNWTEIEYAGYDTLDALKEDLDKVPLFNAVAYGNGMWIGVRTRYGKIMSEDDDGYLGSTSNKTLKFNYEVGYSTKDFPTELSDWTYRRFNPNQTVHGSASYERYTIDIVYYKDLFYSAYRLNGNNLNYVVFKDIRNTKLLLSKSMDYKFSSLTNTASLQCKFFIAQNNIYTYNKSFFAVLDTIDSLKYPILDEPEETGGNSYNLSKNIGSSYPLKNFKFGSVLIDQLGYAYGNGIYVCIPEASTSVGLCYYKGTPSHMTMEYRAKLESTISTTEANEYLTQFKSDMLEYTTNYIDDIFDNIEEDGKYQTELAEITNDLRDHVYGVDYKVSELSTISISDYGINTQLGIVSNDDTTQFFMLPDKPANFIYNSVDLIDWQRIKVCDDDITMNCLLFIPNKNIHCVHPNKYLLYGLSEYDIYIYESSNGLKWELIKTIPTWDSNNTQPGMDFISGLMVQYDYITNTFVGVNMYQNAQINLAVFESKNGTDWTPCTFEFLESNIIDYSSIFWRINQIYNISKNYYMPSILIRASFTDDKGIKHTYIFTRDSGEGPWKQIENINDDSSSETSPNGCLKYDYGNIVYSYNHINICTGGEIVTNFDSPSSRKIMVLPNYNDLKNPVNPIIFDGVFSDYNFYILIDNDNDNMYVMRNPYDSINNANTIKLDQHIDIVYCESINNLIGINSTTGNIYKFTFILYHTNNLTGYSSNNHTHELYAINNPKNHNITVSSDNLTGIIDDSRFSNDIINSVFEISSIEDDIIDINGHKFIYTGNPTVTIVGLNSNFRHVNSVVYVNGEYYLQIPYPEMYDDYYQNGNNLALAFARSSDLTKWDTNYVSLSQYKDYNFTTYNNLLNSYYGKLVYENSKFYYFGEYFFTVISDDFNNWETHLWTIDGKSQVDENLTTTEYFNSLSMHYTYDNIPCFANGCFYLIFQSGNIMYKSENGYDFISCELPFTSETGRILYNEAANIAVTIGNVNGVYKVFYTSDFETWNSHDMPISIKSNTYLSEIEFINNKIFIYDQHTPTFAYTDDITSGNYILCNYLEDLCKEIYNISYNNGVYVIYTYPLINNDISVYTVNNGVIYYTTDLINFNSIDNTYFNYSNIFYCIDNDNNFISFYSNASNYDGKTGIYVNKISFYKEITDGDIIHVNSDSPCTYFVTEAENISVKSDINWNEGNMPSSQWWRSVCYGNGVYVAISNSTELASSYNFNSNIFAYSTDGINWTEGTLPSSQCWQSVCYGNGMFVAVASTTNIFAYSTDGINWIKGNMPSRQYWKFVCYGNDKFVAIASSTNIFAYSTDGINWTQGTLPSSEYWNSVCYGNGKFITMNGSYTKDSNTYYYSTDGINWTEGNMPSNEDWYSVCYGNDKFVATTTINSNIFAYSYDGINWTQGNMPSSNYWTSVCYGNGIFIAIASSTNVFAYSTDGINWTQGNLPSTMTYNVIQHCNDKFIITTGYSEKSYNTIVYAPDFNGSSITGLVEYSTPTDTTVTWESVQNKPTNFSDLGIDNIYTSTEVDEILNPITEKNEFINTSVNTLSTEINNIIPDNLGEMYTTNYERAVALNNKLDELLHTIGLSDADIQEIINMYKKPSLVYKKK